MSKKLSQKRGVQIRYGQKDRHLVVTVTNTLPNVVAEWLTPLLRILEVPGSNLGPQIGYLDWGFPWFWRNILSLSSALKNEAIISSETLLSTDKSSRSPEDEHRHHQRGEELKSHVVKSHFKDQWKLYVPPALTVSNRAFDLRVQIWPNARDF
jgi:hypothetical protein